MTASPSHHRSPASAFEPAARSRSVLGAQAAECQSVLQAVMTPFSDT